MINEISGERDEYEVLRPCKEREALTACVELGLLEVGGFLNRPPTGFELQVPHLSGCLGATKI